MNYTHTKTPSDSHVSNHRILCDIPVALSTTYILHGACSLVAAAAIARPPPLACKGYRAHQYSKL